MQDLLAYLQKNKDCLNLAEISRKAGYDSSYLKKVLAGEFRMSDASARKIRHALRTLGFGGTV